MKRTLAIGDIHGCYDALRRLVEFVAVTDEDLIVALGDYVDRGPDSKLVVELLMRREANGLLVALRGNHDEMMCAARDDRFKIFSWTAVGGAETIESYLRDSKEAGFEAVPASHWDFLESRCQPYYETETHIFVHAGVDPDLPMEEQNEETLYWQRLSDTGPHCSGKTVICGHTAQDSGVPLSFGHTICIDTWVYGDGWLTCLDVDSGDFWQAKQNSDETRRGNIADLGEDGMQWPE